MPKVRYKKKSPYRPWRPMEPGDIVDIVAPASSGTLKGLKRAMQFVRAMDLEPRVSENIFGRHLFCAHSDEERFKQLKKAIYAKDSKLVWSLRGGWGSARLLPQMLRLQPPKENKIFIGYSDLTTLHILFNFSWKWATLHGSMLESLAKAPRKSREVLELCRLVFGEVDSLTYTGLYPLNNLAREERQLDGFVVGGNLTLLQSVLGTPLQPSLKGKILVLEDVNERGYQIDRMLVHLRQSGVFHGVKAIIFGDFVGTDRIDIWRYLREDFAQTLSIPILRGLPIGHRKGQRPLPLWTPAKLELGRRATLRVESGVIHGI